MRDIYCSRCTDPLAELGGLMFGPPEEDGRCEKRHLCVTCWEAVVGGVDELAEVTRRGNRLATQINAVNDVNRELRRQIAALERRSHDAEHVHPD